MSRRTDASSSSVENLIRTSYIEYSFKKCLIQIRSEREREKEKLLALAERNSSSSSFAMCLDILEKNNNNNYVYLYPYPKQKQFVRWFTIESDGFVSNACRNSRRQSIFSQESVVDNSSMFIWKLYRWTSFISIKRSFSEFFADYFNLIGLVFFWCLFYDFRAFATIRSV